VPKDEISYRQATQLHPQDSILLSAVIHQFGHGIEGRRLPADHVFSYRFAPSSQHGLYGSQTAWNDFWIAAHARSFTCSTVLYCDIADFYNQIYHHTVENQLIASGFPNQARRWVIKLLESTTAGVSRGVPIGPHGAHLIAEATMIPIDNSMVSTGFSFLRYADDILVFCDSEKASRQALASIASILDKQQRLTLQRHKTKFFRPDEFRRFCSQMIEDRPISQDEDELLKLIGRYSGGNPYRTVSYDEISPEDWKKITEKIIRGIIREYIEKPEVDYIRLRWFYRRLSQIGHPGAIDVSLEELEKLGPCFANICSYLASVQAIDADRWKGIGSRLLGLLESRVMSFSGSRFLACFPEMPTLITSAFWLHGFRRATPMPEERYSSPQRKTMLLIGCASTRKTLTAWTLGSEWPSFSVAQTCPLTRRSTFLTAGPLIGPLTSCSQSGLGAPNPTLEGMRHTAPHR
jgi:retron-type reverse transcriptase